MDISPEMARDFANDNLSHADIADKYNLSWDAVQRTRSKWRKANGIQPLPRGPKSNINVVASVAPVEDDLTAWTKTNTPILDIITQLRLEGIDDETIRIGALAYQKRFIVQMFDLIDGEISA